MSKDISLLETTQTFDMPTQATSVHSHYQKINEMYNYIALNTP